MSVNDMNGMQREELLYKCSITDVFLVGGEGWCHWLTMHIVSQNLFLYYKPLFFIISYFCTRNDHCVLAYHICSNMVQLEILNDNRNK